MSDSFKKILGFSVPSDFRKANDYRLYSLSVDSESWEKNLDWSVAIDSHKSLSAPLQKYASDLAVRSAHIEQLGLSAAASLASEAPSFLLRINLARAVADEARHACLFARYAQEVSEVSLESASTLLLPLVEELSDRNKFVHRFFVHTLKENQALAIFRILSKIFHGSFIGDLYSYVRMDEARHVAMGIRYLREYAQESNEAAKELTSIEQQTMTGAAITKEKAEDYARYSIMTVDEVWKIVQDTHTAFMKKILDKDYNVLFNDEEVFNVISSVV